MPFVAYLDGRRFDATAIPHEQWRALNKRPDYKQLTLLECGSRAKRVTRYGTQFFAHVTTSDCDITHKSESAQHTAMKAVLVDRINALPGWRAEPEHPAPDRSWIADVMAIHETGRRVAFEVQLSDQSQEDYAHRTQRYFDAGILPVWLTPRMLVHADLLVPYVRIGIDKNTALPEDRRQLLLHADHQTILDREATVEQTVRWILHPRYTWCHGDPKQQAAEAARRIAEWERRQAAEQRRWDERSRTAQKCWDRSGKPKATPSRVKARLEPSAAAVDVLPTAQQVFWSWYSRRMQELTGQPLPGKPSLDVTVATRGEHHPVIRYPHLQRVRLVPGATKPLACIGYPQNTLGPGWEEAFRELVYIAAVALDRVHLTRSVCRTPVSVALRPATEPQGAGVEVLLDRKDPLLLKLQVLLDETDDSDGTRDWVVETLVAAKREISGTWKAIEGRADRRPPIGG